MNMDENSPFDILYQKILRKLDEEVVPYDGDTMSLYDFNEALSSGIDKYNDIFINKMGDLKKQLNRKIYLSKITKKNIPLIDNIYPYVDVDGNYGININFAEVFSGNRRKFIGQANISDRGVVNIDYLLKGFSKEDTLEFVKKHLVNFVDYLGVLAEFSNEYPGFPYEWNDMRDEYKQEIDDGFVTGYIDITKPEHVSVSLSNRNDLEVSRYRTRKYGELYDYIDFYKNGFMKRIKVNINDFNPLYQTIAKKGLENLEEKKLKRVI